MKSSIPPRVRLEMEAKRFCKISAHWERYFRAVRGIQNSGEHMIAVAVAKKQWNLAKKVVSEGTKTELPIIPRFKDIRVIRRAVSNSESKNLIGDQWYGRAHGRA